MSVVSPAGGHEQRARRPRRTDGYAPIADYAAIGDMRTVALVALDGSIDWLCLPALDAPSTFAALLDPARGGRFALAPAVPFAAERDYEPDTNVLATTFRTDGGTLRVLDALTFPGMGEPGTSQLVRRVECTAGRVPLRWCVQPRFGCGRRGPARIERGADGLLAHDERLLLALQAWELGEPQVRDGEGAIAGEAELEQGDCGLLVLGAFVEEPLLLPARERAERDLALTCRRWREIAARCTYEGPWRDAVLRSVLALELLLNRETGAMAAAATTSLPERIGGERNYDYRFAWLRDMDFALDALLAAGYDGEVHASLRWGLTAAARTHPRLLPFYRLEGGTLCDAHPLPLAGYRGSRPVVAGNDAREQLQLGTYGTVLNTAWRYVEAGNALDPGSGVRIAELADFVCDAWRTPDSGIWELPERRRYVHSRIACWQALDRALRLAEAGAIPGRRRERWRAQAAAIRRFVEREGWSERRRAFVQVPGGEQLDAALLLASKLGFLARGDPRLRSTIAALRAELGAGGPLLHRTSALRACEGAFVACSFWLVEALADAGATEQAHEAMGAAIALRNDVGLLSEQVDPRDGSFLGNVPQALSHLALIAAAQRLTSVSPETS
jgi:GH15 family glucan-1,4-alpha-glucosidase